MAVINILFDFITISIKTGAGEYQRRVVLNELKRLKEQPENNINVFALYDSSLGIAYDDMREDTLGKEYNITYIDIYKNNINDIIEKYSINRFFIACGQYINSYPGIENVRCEVICVVHDLARQELAWNHIDEYKDIISEKYDFKYNSGSNIINKTAYFQKIISLSKKIFKLRKISHSPKFGRDIDNIISLAINNPHAQIITVSNYSRNSLKYNFNIPDNKVKVLYAPERIYDKSSEIIENKKLSDIVTKKTKYFLLIGAQHKTKNPNKAISAFKKYHSLNPESHLVVLGYNGKETDGIISLPFLCDSDLQNAYKNCYALLYPSFFEGFGYPPIEAMRYNKPVLCTNTTSVPEVLADAPIYFSPFYETDIFKALACLNDSNYNNYSELSNKRYMLIKEKQEADLNTLLDILSNTL